MTMIHINIGAYTKMENEIQRLTAENTALRELMNCYNLGGWTDSLRLMQAAYTAGREAMREEAGSFVTNLAKDYALGQFKEEWEVATRIAEAIRSLKS